MLSKDTFEIYRRMTPGERLSMTFRMIRANRSAWKVGTPEVVARRFERLRQLHEEQNEALMKGLLEAEARRHEHGY